MDTKAIEAFVMGLIILFILWISTLLVTRGSGKREWKQIGPVLCLSSVPILIVVLFFNLVLWR